MFPIDPHTKILIESFFLVVLLGYAAFNFRHPHLTTAVCAVLSVPLLVDIFIFHAVRSIRVTVMLNVPFLLVVTTFSYVRILRKSWGPFRKKLAVVLMLLFGD